MSSPGIDGNVFQWSQELLCKLTEASGGHQVSRRFHQSPGEVLPLGQGTALLEGQLYTESR